MGNAVCSEIKWKSDNEPVLLAYFLYGGKWKKDNKPATDQDSSEFWLVKVSNKPFFFFFPSTLLSSPCTRLLKSEHLLLHYQHILIGEK